MKNTAKTQTVKQRPSRNERDGQEKSLGNTMALTPSSAKTSSYSMHLLPRVIRFKDAPG